MKIQILKIGVVEDIIGSLLGRWGSTSVRTFVFIPELKLAVAQYGGQMFVLDDFEPHEQASVVEELEAPEELVALIRIWSLSQTVVVSSVLNHEVLKQHFEV